MLITAASLLIILLIGVAPVFCILTVREVTRLARQSKARHVSSQESRPIFVRSHEPD